MARGKNPLIKVIKAFQVDGMESISRFYSQYRAYVYNRSDPEGMNRLQLIIPEITGSDYLPIWAYPKDNFAGNGYGAQSMPKVGDVVWVDFEWGDPAVPVWSHGYYAEGEKPEEFKDLNVHGYKTPGGHIITLNDTSGEIIIKRKDGDRIIMTDKVIQIDSDKRIIHGREANYSHVLGEELNDTLNDILEALNKTISALQLDITASAASTFLMKVNLTANIPKALIALKSAMAKVKKILSKQVKLDN
jgi:hypothetical protein